YGGGEVGLSFGHRARAGGGPPLCLGRYLFSNVRPFGGYLSVSLFAPGPPGRVYRTGVRDRFGPAGLGGGAGLQGWRKVAIAVTPGEVRFVFPGLPAGRLPRARLEKDVKLHLGATAAGRAPMGPLGGLGICVYQAKASFRNVTVAPLAGR